MLNRADRIERGLRTAGALLLAVLVSLALGCGSGEQRDPYAQEASDTAASPAPDPTPAEPEPEPEPEPAPEPDAAAVEEEPADPAEALSRGEAVYQQYCASCHGKEGAGDGPVSAGLDPKPAAHNDGGYMNALTDAHLHKVIAEGGASVGKSPLMAPWSGTLSDQQIDDVIIYIRSLAVPPYPGPGMRPLTGP